MTDEEVAPDLVERLSEGVAKECLTTRTITSKGQKERLVVIVKVELPSGC